MSAAITTVTFRRYPSPRCVSRDPSSHLRPACKEASNIEDRAGLRELEIEIAQLPARGNAELSVDVLKVILDCLPAHIELRCRFRVGISLRHEYGNVPLTVGQIERGSG